MAKPRGWAVPRSGLGQAGQREGGAAGSPLSRTRLDPGSRSPSPWMAPGARLDFTALFPRKDLVTAPQGVLGVRGACARDKHEARAPSRAAFLKAQPPSLLPGPGPGVGQSFRRGGATCRPCPCAQSERCTSWGKGSRGTRCSGRPASVHAPDANPGLLPEGHRAPHETVPPCLPPAKERDHSACFQGCSRRNVPKRHSEPSLLPRALEEPPFL